MEDVPAGGALSFPHKAGTIVAPVMPVRMQDDRVVYFPVPSFAAFYLVEANATSTVACGCADALWRRCGLG